MRTTSKVSVAALLIYGAALSLPAAVKAQDPFPAAIAEYQKIVESGGWPKVPAAKFEKLATGEAVDALRQRLAKTGDLDAALAAPGLPFDDVLEQAVKHFQLRHGEEGDGVIGSETLAAMNIPAERRLHQLELNHERFLSLPKTLPGKTVFVNIPNYALAVLDSGQSVLVMKVVVGERFKATPLLVEQIETIVFNPAWNLPNDIVRDELAAKVLKNPGYLAEKDLELIRGGEGTSNVIDPSTVNWANLGESLGFRVRQKPGLQNSLGRIKFMLPNSEDIYLHDTPEKDLFDENERKFSHGCIRVEKPLELAVLLLDDDPKWTREYIEQVIASGETVTAKIPNKVPIQLIYWTAWVNPDGQIQFREDLYKLDNATAAATTTKGT